MSWDCESGFQRVILMFEVWNSQVQRGSPRNLDSAILSLRILGLRIDRMHGQVSQTRSRHRWSRDPRPQPRKFSKLVFLIWFSESKLLIWGSSWGREFWFHWSSSCSSGDGRRTWTYWALYARTPWSVLIISIRRTSNRGSQNPYPNTKQIHSKPTFSKEMYACQIQSPRVWKNISNMNFWNPTRNSGMVTTQKLTLTPRDKAIQNRFLNIIPVLKIRTGGPLGSHDNYQFQRCSKLSLKPVAYVSGIYHCRESSPHP